MAKLIFEAFTDQIYGLKFYLLDCGCIYYQRVFENGDLDPQVGIYRDAEDGPCNKCLLQEATWKDGILNEVTLYNPHLGVSTES